MVAVVYCYQLLTVHRAGEAEILKQGSAYKPEPPYISLYAPFITINLRYIRYTAQQSANSV